MKASQRPDEPLTVSRVWTARPDRLTAWKGRSATYPCGAQKSAKTLFLLARPLALWGGLCCLITAETRRLSAEEAAGVPIALPEPGGVRELPAATSQASPLVNPGFEQQWEGWTPQDQEGFSIETRPGTAHRGQSCLRFDCGRQTRYAPSLRQNVGGIASGVNVLRFWVRLDGVSDRPQQTSGVRVSIEYLLKDGQRAWPSTSIFRGTADWRQQELKAYIPPEADPASVAICIHRYGAATRGTAWFDNFSLTCLRPPAIETFLVHPNFRGYLSDDEPAAVRLWVRRDAAQTRAPIRVEVREGSERQVVASKILAGDVAEQIVELDSSAWPVGSYAVEARADECCSTPIVVQKISAEQRQQFSVWFDANQVLHFQGQPVFPIGLYNTTRRFYNRDEEFDWSAETARLENMAEAPVNANVNYWFWAPSIEVRRKYLEAMNRLGIGYLDTVNNVYPGFPVTPCVAELLPDAADRKHLDTQELVDQYLTRLAERMRTQPAMLGWYVMDERSFAEVPEHFHQYRNLAKADPDHLALGVSNQPHELDFWRDSLDVIGLDPYPLMNMKAGRPLTLVGEWTRAARQATFHSRPVWMVIQFFQGWSTDRWPTEEELRTMSLMAIAEGARGLLYWSYGARALMGVKDPQHQEEYWRRLMNVTRELRSLQPALLAADANESVTSVSDPRIRWLARVADGKCYVFAYLPAERFVTDPSAAERTEVRFTLADGQTISRTFRPDFADWFAVSWLSNPHR